MTPPRTAPTFLHPAHPPGAGGRAAPPNPGPVPAMNELDQALSRLLEHPGVEHLLLLGHDGLLVRHLGSGGRLDADTVAAMTPDVVAACTAFARAAERGAFATAVLELADAVAIVTTLSPELLLALVLRPGVGFAPLLRELRQERGRIATLV